MWNLWNFWNFKTIWKTKVFFRNSRFPVRSVFVINVSLFTSVICYYQNGLRRKHGKCLLWWHSFMNQRLNHLVLLYEKCNCIRIMSLNTCNKNVDITWHCIISQIKLHGFWKRSALTNMKKGALKSTRDSHISPRTESQRANMGRGLILHVIWNMPYHNL